MRNTEAVAQTRRAAMFFAMAALAAGSGCAEASFHPFVIDELYSSPDGMVQFPDQ